MCLLFNGFFFEVAGNLKFLPTFSKYHWGFALPTQVNPKERKYYPLRQTPLVLKTVLTVLIGAELPDEAHNIL